MGNKQKMNMQYPVNDFLKKLSKEKKKKKKKK